jgi:hypothetical protein
MDAIWRRLIAGQLTPSELPEELDLPDVLSDVERLWQLTAKDRKEHGACIVLDEHDRLRVDHEVAGEERGVNPMHRVSDYHDHLGFFHTHPLQLDGTEQVGFSEKDFAGALEDGEKLSVVCSGNKVFALVRTEKTRLPAPVSQQEENEWGAVFKQYLDDNSLTEGEAQRQATIDLCCRLGFAFYAGEFGHLLRRASMP